MTHGAQPPAGGQVLIEGGFTHDALPDLLRYLAGRRETLLWELTSLAGTFLLTLEGGEPTDILFRPVRVGVGAYPGEKALRILFQQAGGRFVVRRAPPAHGRRSLTRSAEQLLIEMATLADESVAGAVLAGRTFDSAEDLALVQGVTLPDHQTAFRARAQDVPLLDVLQLFSVNRKAFWVEVYGAADLRLGRVHLGGQGEVNRAEHGEIQGAAAFSALLAERAAVSIDVRPTDLPLAAGETLGKLDALLMAEFLAGRLNMEPKTPDAPGAMQDGQPAPDLEVTDQNAPPAATGLLGRLFGRRKT